MPHIDPPPLDALPTPRALRRSALIAVVAAAVLFVVAVLPAERAIDLTGLGTVIGLQEMGDVKAGIEAEVASDSILAAAQARADSMVVADSITVLRAIATGVRPPRTDTTTITIPPADERAVRLRVRARAWIVYSWSTNRGVVDDDVRGDSTGALDTWYHRYGSGSARASNVGVIMARFDGSHGWHWRNVSDSAVTVTIITRGDYSPIARR